MNINFIDTIFIVFVTVFLCLFFKVKKVHKLDKIILFFTIFSPICFSALGLLFVDFNNSKYIFSYILYLICLFFTVLLGIRSNKKLKSANHIERILKENEEIFNILGWFALFLQLTLLIYPNFKLFDLFVPFRNNYSFNGGNYFSNRIFQRTDSISQILSLLRTAMLPFFYILLYNHRKNAKFVIFIYLFYDYITYINEYYIQRNKIVLMIVFILIYLWNEKKIKEKNLKKYIMILIPVIICMVGFLGVYRTNGMGNTISIKDSIKMTIYEEAYTQSHIELCNNISSKIFFPKMILSIVTAPLFFMPDVEFPTLAYLFTEELIGLSYGEKNYYIMLPCSYAEGVMVFGANFAFLYGIFLGIGIVIVYNILKKIEHANYFLIYIILNYIACFRGSVQSFLLQTVNLLFSFIVITFCVGIINKKNQSM